MDQSRLMTGMFRDRESCERAYGCLTDRGYTKDDVTLLMSDEGRKRHFAPSGDKAELGTKAAEGAGVGAVVGGGVGALLGGVAGGLLGALIGWGIPEERAREYKKGIREGGIVMGVTPRTPEDAEYFDQEWRRYRGEPIHCT